jgi:hypothetical protein
MIQSTLREKVPAVAPTETPQTKSFRDSSPTLPVHHFIGNRYHAAHLPEPGDRTRPATLLDVIVDRGEYVGDGQCRTLGGYSYEPLSWGALIRI